MSTYRPKGRTEFRYDFWLQGVRFHGATGSTNKRDADAAEKQKRREAEKLLAESGAALKSPMTVALAATQYWNEVGRHAKSSVDIDRMIRWLVREIGGKKHLTSVNGSVVAALVAKRRGEPGRKGRPLSPAAVNRPIELLRSIVSRAERVWEQPVARVEWRKHRLKEPQERVRELRGDEEKVLFAHLRADYHEIVKFALISGCRLHECVGLLWSDVDWGGRQIWIRGKGDTLAAIPLSPTLRELLWPLQGQHPEAVFTYVVDKARGDRRKGERRPITYEGLKTTFARFVKPHLRDYRFHDNRHTAATRILRASGNLRVAQVLLRHTNISTTTKYAHVMQDDVMAAMEGAAKLYDEAPAPKPGTMIAQDAEG